MTADLFYFCRAPSSYYTYFYTLGFFKEHPCERTDHLTWARARQPPRAWPVAPGDDGMLAVVQAVLPSSPLLWALGFYVGWHGKLRDD